MVRRGGIRTLKEASSGTFHRALRRPYAKVLRLPIPPRARGTKYRPTRASNNRAPPQPSPPKATHASYVDAFRHGVAAAGRVEGRHSPRRSSRSEEHTSELQ